MWVREHHRLRPSLDALEARSVLSHVSSTFNVLTSGFHPNLLAIRRNRPASPVALVNQAFVQFQQDFTRARSVYDNLVLSGKAQMVDQSAFKGYTDQRVNLLAEQLTNVFISSPLATARSHGMQPAITIISRKINAPARSVDSGGAVTVDYTNFANGTLGRAVETTTPTFNNQSPTSIALDTQAQDQAIQAAQVAMVNALNIIKTGAFGTGSSHGKH